MAWFPGLLSHFDSVIISSLKRNHVFAAHEPVAGIILAAGGSTRYGQTKQLLDWHGQPFVRVVAKTALEAGLSPVIVVTGANAEGVEAAVNDLPVTIKRNDDWQTGQSSSIRAGIQAISDSSRTPAWSRNISACRSTPDHRLGDSSSDGNPRR